MPPSPLYALQWFRPFSSPICALCQPVDKEILKPFCGKCQEGLTEHNSGDGWASSLIGLAWARATKKNSSQSYWAKGQMLKELKHPKNGQLMGFPKVNSRFQVCLKFCPLAKCHIFQLRIGTWLSWVTLDVSAPHKCFWTMVPSRLARTCATRIAKNQVS